jgi:hypothetical protein
VQADRERAIRFAIENAKPHDCVLIAGKGHEDYQILPAGVDAHGRMTTRTIPFDDREVARACLDALGLPTRRATPAPDNDDQPDSLPDALDLLGDDAMSEPALQDAAPARATGQSTPTP